MEKIEIIKLSANAIVPTYAHDIDAGMDLYSTEKVYIAPMERRIVKTGIAVNIPAGFEMQVRPRSGMSIKSGVTVLNAPGTIDAGYHNELGVVLINLSTETYIVKEGDRIAQLVYSPVYKVAFTEVTEFSTDSERGMNGYGSSGR